MKKILLSLFLIISIFLVTNVEINAIVLDEPSGISDLSVTKTLDGNINITFLVNQDMDFDSEWDYISIYLSGNQKNYSFDTSNNSDDFSSLENVTKGTDIVFSSQLDEEVDSLSIYLSYTGEDNIKYEETVEYNIINSKIKSVDLFNNNYASLMNTGVEKKYNGYVLPMMGDSSGFTFVYDIDKGQNGFENAIKLGFISYSDFNRSLDDVLKDIDKLIKEKNITLVEEANQDKVGSDFLEEIKSLGQTYTYEEKNGDKINYAWTFDGSKITNTDLLVDLNLKIGDSSNQEKIEALISQKEKSLVLEFAHHGELPEGTKIKVNVLDKFKDGSNLTLYYYNESGKLEEITKNLEVKNGYVEFSLDHCSEYVLVEKLNNAQTGVLDVTLYSMIILGSLALISVLLKKNSN